MKRSPRPRRIAALSDSLQQQLNMYALAASAASVGVLATPQTAHAKVIYTHLHHVIAENSSFNIDLNHDGVTDFAITNYGGVSSKGSGNFLMANGVGIMNGTWPYWPWFLALPRGARVGQGCCWVYYENGILVNQCRSIRGTNSAPPCYAETYERTGYWGNVKNRYLGLAFPINGKMHYGWARLSVSVARNPIRARAVLTGYAYETIPNKAIISGMTEGPDVVTVRPDNVQPVSLGRLALGRK